MDQHEQDTSPYEAPEVEDLEAAEGPASIQAGTQQTPVP
jgi:hypothetical protein